MKSKKAYMAVLRNELRISQRSNQLQSAIPSLRAIINEIVPKAFSWWIEIDSDVGISVRWIWLGHPGVTRIGCVSDADTSIMVNVLRQINWDDEVNAAIETVESFEREALKVAQANRKALITSAESAKPLEMPAPSPFTLAGKKHVAQIARADSLKSRRKRELFQEQYAPPPKIACDGVNRVRVIPPSNAPLGQLLPPTLKDELPEYALSTSRHPNPRACTWIPCESLAELMHEVYIQPRDTFQRAVILDIQWRTPAVIEYITHCEILKNFITPEAAAQMSAQDFYAKSLEIISKIEIVRC